MLTLCSLQIDVIYNNNNNKIIIIVIIIAVRLFSVIIFEQIKWWWLQGLPSQRESSVRRREVRRLAVVKHTDDQWLYDRRWCGRRSWRGAWRPGDVQRLAVRRRWRRRRRSPSAGDQTDRVGDTSRLVWVSSAVVACLLPRRLDLN